MQRSSASQVTYDGLSRLLAEVLAPSRSSGFRGLDRLVLEHAMLQKLLLEADDGLIDANVIPAIMWFKGVTLDLTAWHHVLDNLKERVQPAPSNPRSLEGGSISGSLPLVCIVDSQASSASGSGAAASASSSRRLQLLTRGLCRALVCHIREFKFLGPGWDPSSSRTSLPQVWGAAAPQNPPRGIWGGRQPPQPGVGCVPG